MGLLFGTQLNSITRMFVIFAQVVVTGYFKEQYKHLAKSNLSCVCGDTCVPAEIVQEGVYRCFVSPHYPGIVNLFLSLDGYKPISQVLNFEYCIAPHGSVISSEDKPNWDELKLQIRLAQLLLSTSRRLNIFTRKVSPSTLKEAKKFAEKTSENYHGWAHLMKLIEHNKLSSVQAKDSLFEVTLKNMVKNWLVERIAEGCKTTEYDSQGLGVIHLCSVLGYSWSIHLFLRSGLSLDFRDKRGWTALHWAAYCGRFIFSPFCFAVSVSFHLHVSSP